MENDDQRYSPSLEACIWHIMDGKFDPTLFEKQYVDSLKFTKEVWGDKKGPKWNDFDVVARRANSPEFYTLYVNGTYRFGDAKMGCSKLPTRTFHDKLGDCSDMLWLGQTFLGYAGYSVQTLASSSNHVVGAIKRDGQRWRVLNWRGHKNWIHGPYDNVLQIGSPWFHTKPCN